MARPRSPYDYDICRIVEALAAGGYQCGPELAEELWKKYSDGYAAGWLHLPEEDEEIVRSLCHLFETEEED